MELKAVCQRLERDFPLKFARSYEPLGYIFPAVNREAGIKYGKIYDSKFLDYFNGLMVKGEKHVNKVYCTVFPDAKVLERIVSQGREGDLIFTHHCCGYDSKNGFVPIPPGLVEEMKGRGISLYSLHVPLDVNGPWSTSVQLANALDIDYEGEFAVVIDKPTGVYGKPPVGDLKVLAGIVSRVTGCYEAAVIANRREMTVKRVAVIAGGGGYDNLISDAHRFECDTFITGTVIEEVEIEAVKEANLRFRQKAVELGIHLIGGGHYHTERVAVERMTAYFGELGLEAEFVPA